ncbi:hypothetical protein Vretimale_17157 [Volvox reticuliferus]|uniref:F-box domain-containing protein n=1 Tax=Volvox reticuliferus TaxID=1737510 RepID=A0A8J4GSG6_9CHLO|nr:hypothetical protein Vretifemale_18587 [Volvox reticuliferus]GIM14141.1 hypothetical protein Vretimale_17157 [Volvox reticuliferus]
MPPKSSKSRRQQTITYHLSNANARDAFEEELELEDAERQHRHTAGRAKRTGHGSAAFSLAADMPLSLHDRDISGMHEYSSPKATTDMINLLELFGASLDRELIENVYLGSNSKFNLAMERLLELAAGSCSNGSGAAGSGGGGASASEQEAVDSSAAGSEGNAASLASVAADTALGSSTGPTCYWDLLPDDLKRHVLAFFSSRDLARVARTCWDFAGSARSLRTNARQLQIPTGLGMHGIMAMVAGHPNARAISLRQWASVPLSDTDFTALVVALSTGSRSERRLVPVEALSFKGCRWLSDGHVMAVCHTMQHLKEVELTDCVGITDAALVALSKYQRLAPEGNSSSSSDVEYEGDATPLATTATSAAAAAAAAVTTPSVGPARPTQGLSVQRSSGGGVGSYCDDDDGDDELQFEFDATPAPPKQRNKPLAPRGADASAALSLQHRTEAGSIDDNGDNDGIRRRSISSDSGSDDEDDAVADTHVGDGGKNKCGAVAATSPSPVSALHGEFAAALVLSPPTAAHAGSRGPSEAGDVATPAMMPATLSVPPRGGSGDSGHGRRGTRGSDSAAATPLYGTSPLVGSLTGTSYGASRGGAGSPWLYGVSPAGPGGIMTGAVAAGTRSWLYGSSPVMGMSPFFRTGGATNITHNGWLARAATAATHHSSGRGLMSINVSGCIAISSDGVKALLSAPLPKACLLQLDISRCPRITRAALILPATSNLCVLRASACNNLHEVIMQLPLTSPLTELHLADCKQLSKLHVVAPALQQLHVGSCRHLSRLHLRCPQLRHLTASLCFRLVDLDPERWEVSRLEHLNLFGCRHLEWPGLTALLAMCGTSLRHLDINGCNSLVEVDIPAGNDGLRHLDASGCKSLVALHCHSPALTALTLRACPRLQEVALESAVLMRLDISNCPHLQRLAMPALRQQEQHDMPAPAAGAGANLSGAGQVGALRAVVGSGSSASVVGAGLGPVVATAADGGSSGGGAGLMVRMAGCDRLPVEIAVMLRRLREKAKQQATAPAAVTTTPMAVAASQSLGAPGWGGGLGATGLRP